MEFIEKIFQNLWQRGSEKKAKSQTAYFAEEGSRNWETIAGALQPSENLCQSEPIQALGSREFVGLHGNSLFLPEKIDLFNDRELNRKLYIHLILLICGLRRIGARNEDSDLGSPLNRRWQVMQRMYLVNSVLDQQLPSFREFQSDLLSRIQSENHLLGAKEKKMFEFWSKVCGSRSAMGSQDISIGADLFGGSKRNEKIPPFLFLTVPCLERAMDSSKKDLGGPTELTDRALKIQTEKKKTYSSIVERVDLQKEQANPVTHSFEKLETADEYNGGRRFDSGEDELDDHSAALDELNFTSVTTGGEAAQSIYQADGIFQGNLIGSEITERSDTKAFYYPEWNAKRFVYMRNYCRLLENPTEIHGLPAAVLGGEKQRLKETYRRQIQNWRGRIEALLTSPLWVRRLKDGDELDYDEFVRDFVMLQSKRDVEGRWYTKKRPSIKDAAILILFDQSWSSDSYVKNRRVLDVIRDSIGVAGLLFENVIKQVAIAGTWSSTRHQCSYQVYKQSSESWDEFFKKTEGIQAQGYTRLGPAIRHATQDLAKLPQKKKLLLILTDGKPTDLDGYEGVHGIQDVKFACREAEILGILPYALTIDDSAKRHFPKMFKHYTLLQNPQMFSEEIFKILLQMIKQK